MTQTYAKKHTIKVEAGGRVEEVKGGTTQTLEGGGGYDQKIAPKWHTKVEGPWKFEAQSVKWDIEANVDVECMKWEVLQKGEVSWKTLGNICWSHLANENKLTVGHSSEVYVGGKEEVFVGVKAALSIAAALEIFAGAKCEVSIGPKVELETIHLKNKAAELEETAAKVEERLTRLEETPAHITVNAIKMTTVAMFMVL